MESKRAHNLWKMTEQKLLLEPLIVSYAAIADVLITKKKKTRLVQKQNQHFEMVSAFLYKPM